VGERNHMLHGGPDPPRERDNFGGISRPTVNTHTHTHQPFNALWSGNARVSRYQKKHSPTHTHPDHWTSFINFLHLLRSIASTLFSLCARQPSDNLSPGPLWSSSWSCTLYIILLTHCKVQRISSVNQSYLAGGCSNAAVCCRYCTNLSCYFIH